MTTLLLLVVLAQTPDSPASVARTFVLMNAERARHGLSPYRPSVTLGGAARVHSLDQARRGRMGHHGSDGSWPWNRTERLGYRGSTVGENVAFNYQSPESVVQGWMTSPGHRAAILSRSFTECGVACEMSNRGPMWTATFGRPGP